MATRGEAFVASLVQSRNGPVKRIVGDDQGKPISGPTDPRWRDAIQPPEEMRPESLDEAIARPGIAVPMAGAGTTKRILISYGRESDSFVVTVEENGVIARKAVIRREGLLAMIPVLKLLATVSDMTEEEFDGAAESH